MWAGFKIRLRWANCSYAIVVARTFQKYLYFWKKAQKQGWQTADVINTTGVTQLILTMIPMLLEGLNDHVLLSVSWWWWSSRVVGWQSPYLPREGQPPPPTPHPLYVDPPRIGSMPATYGLIFNEGVEKVGSCLFRKLWKYEEKFAILLVFHDHKICSRGVCVCVCVQQLCYPSALAASI